jgi:hypothetical protein
MRGRVDFGLASCAAALLCSCVVLRSERIDPHATYDASGRLVVCARGALKVAREPESADFERWLGEEWNVSEALALRVRAKGGVPELLTRNLDSEFDLALAPDGRGLVFRTHVGSGQVGLLQPHVEWGWIELAPNADALDVTEFGQASPVWKTEGCHTGFSLNGCRGGCEAWSSWFEPQPAHAREVLAPRSLGRDAGLMLRWSPRGEAPQDIRVENPCAVALSPDGRRLAIVERQRTILQLLVVELRSESATLREYDARGALLRRLEL